MNNVIIGEKGGPKEGYYESAVDVLVRLEKLKIKWFSTKFLPTNEKLKTRYYYVLRQYARDLLDSYTKCDWDAISNLPREKEGTAYQLKINYIPSKKLVALQVIEARTGSDGGYFNITPPILYFEEEAEKIFPNIEKLL